ncbi:MAG: hypothetical protein R3F61_32845 [Myxococcota bacterium]
MIVAQPSLRMSVGLAESPTDVAACEELVAETYLREYGVLMTPDRTDPDGLVERMPDRFVMGRVDGELVSCAGLYVGRTYVEEFGGVTREDIDRVLNDAGVWEDRPRVRVEYTKVVVRQEFGRRGIGRHFIGATHSADFLRVDGQPPVLLVCAKLSILRLWRAVGIRTRKLRDFPAYRNHARYRRSGDPMESHLIIPEQDIHPRWYDLSLPATLDVGVLGGVIAD